MMCERIKYSYIMYRDKKIPKILGEGRWIFDKTAVYLTKKFFVYIIFITNFWL